MRGLSLICRDTLENRSPKSRLKNVAASALIAAGIISAAWGFGGAAISAGETRSISLYAVNTGESLAVTYMVNGKYVPSGLKKINYLLRDWRRKEVITIDPKIIDLMWELHADLGSRAPVHIICGFRSPKTNAFLKRIGRNVARKSQHMHGKAIDLYFPDIPTEKLRNSALVRKVGGVGYYRSSGGPNGFVHLDTGNVRHWGPGISSTQMAKITREYSKTVGARLNRNGQKLIAGTEVIAPSQQPVANKAYEYNEDDMAELSASASLEQTAKTPKKLEINEAAPADIVKAYPIPKPRPKPIEVLMMAAVNMKIEPASAPPEGETEEDSIIGSGIGALEAPETMAELTTGEPVSNRSQKGGLAESLRDGVETNVPVIRPISASTGGIDIDWLLPFNGESQARRDGAPQPFAETDSSILPGSDAPVEPLEMPEMATGKGDLLVVNRAGKGSLETLRVLPAIRRQSVGLLEEQ